MNRIQKGVLCINKRTYPVYEGHNTIGRNPNATIIIKDLQVSHNHAIITVVDNKHYVSEISACNGTYLNEEKLLPLMLHEIPNNAIIKFGNTTAVYSSTQQITQADSSSNTQNYSESFFEAPTQLLDISKTCGSNISINDMPTQVLNGHLQDISDIHNVNTQIQDIRKVLANDSTLSIHDLPTQPILQEGFDNSAISEKIIDETKCNDLNDADSNDSFDLMTLQPATQKQDECSNQDGDSPLHTSQLHRKTSRTICSESDTDDEKSNESEILRNKLKTSVKPLIDSSGDETDIEDMKLDKSSKICSHDNSANDETDAEINADNKLDNLNDSDFIPATQEANINKTSKNKDNVGTCSLGDSFHLHLTELTSTEKSINSEDSSNQESVKSKNKYLYSQDHKKEEAIIKSANINLENNINKINDTHTNSTKETSVIFEEASTSILNNIKNANEQLNQTENIENGDNLMNSEKQNEDTCAQSTKVIVCENDKTSNKKQNDDDQDKNDSTVIQINEDLGKGNEKECENIDMQPTQIITHEDIEVQNSNKTKNSEDSANTNIDDLINNKKQIEDMQLTNGVMCENEEGLNKCDIKMAEVVIENDKLEENKRDCINNEDNVEPTCNKSLSKDSEEESDNVYMQQTQIIINEDREDYPNQAIDNKIIEASNNTNKNEVINTEISTIHTVSIEDLQIIKEKDDDDDDIYVQPTQKIDWFADSKVHSRKTIEKDKECIESVNVSQTIDQFKKPSSNVNEENIFLAPTQHIESSANDVYLQPTQKIHENNPVHPAENDDIFLQPTQLISAIDVDASKEIENNIFLQPTQIIDSNDGKVEPCCKDVESKRNIVKICAEVESQLEVMFSSQNKFSETDNSRPIDPVASTLSFCETPNTEVNDAASDDTPCSTSKHAVRRSTRKRSITIAETNSTKKRSKRKFAENQNKDSDSGILQSVSEFTVTDVQRDNNSNHVDKIDGSNMMITTISTRSKRIKSKTSNINTKSKKEENEEVNLVSPSNASENDDLIKETSNTKSKSFENDISKNKSNLREQTPKRSKRIKSKNDRNENEASTSCYSAIQTDSINSADANESDSENDDLVKALTNKLKNTKSKSSENDVSKNNSSVLRKQTPNRSKRTKSKNDGNENEASTTKSADANESDSSSNLINNIPKRGKRTKSCTNDGNESEASSSSYSVQTKRTKTSILNETSLLSTPERSRRKLKPKVVFTMFESPEMEMLVRRLGGSLVDSAEACTVLITKCVKRSQKLLSAVGQGKPICSPSWLEACKKANQFLDPWDYIIKDEEAENKWKFSLEESLQRSLNEKLLSNYKFLILTTTACDVLKGAIEACDGKCVSKAPPKSFKGNFVVISEKNKSENAKYKKQNIPVVEAEAIFDGVLRQKLELEKHLL